MAKLSPADFARRKFAEKILKAKSVNLPQLLMKEFDFPSPVSSGKNHLDFEGRGVRTTLKTDGFHLANGSVKGDAIQVVATLKQCDNKTAANFILEWMKANPDLQTTEVEAGRSQNYRALNNEGMGTRSRKVDIKQGYAFALERGISKANLDHAIESGFCEIDPKGIRFKGHDNTFYEIRMYPDLEKEYGFKCLAYSEKVNVPILQGDPREVHLVEGGLSALGVHEIYKEIGLNEPPTVIMRCGQLDSFLQSDECRRLLRNADQIVIWSENEDTVQLQELTDENAKQLSYRLLDVAKRSAGIAIQHPGMDYADTADWARDLNQEKKHNKKLSPVERVATPVKG